MYHFATILTVAVSFAACTSSLVIPRATQPKGWLTAILEVRQAPLCSILSAHCSLAVHHVQHPLHGPLVRDSA